MLGSVLGSGAAAVNKIDRPPCLRLSRSRGECRRGAGSCGVMALGQDRAGPWRSKIQKSTQPGLGGQRRPPGDMICVLRLDGKGEVVEGSGHL